MQKKSTADAIKTTSKNSNTKAAETTSDLIENKIADKVTKASKKNFKVAFNGVVLTKY